MSMGNTTDVLRKRYLGSAEKRKKLEIAGVKAKKT